jgi:hypothetical protein
VPFPTYGKVDVWDDAYAKVVNNAYPPAEAVSTLAARKRSDPSIVDYDEYKAHVEVPAHQGDPHAKYESEARVLNRGQLTSLGGWHCDVDCCAQSFGFMKLARFGKGNGWSGMEEHWADPDVRCEGRFMVTPAAGALSFIDGDVNYSLSVDGPPHARGGAAITYMFNKIKPGGGVHPFIARSGSILLVTIDGNPNQALKYERWTSYDQDGSGKIVEAYDPQPQPSPMAIDGTDSIGMALASGDRFDVMGKARSWYVIPNQQLVGIDLSERYNHAHVTVVLPKASAR